MIGIIMIIKQLNEINDEISKVHNELPLLTKLLNTHTRKRQGKQGTETFVYN